MGLLDLIAPAKKNRDNALASTQTHLRFGEIRDNTLVLKNGGMRAVLKTSSINFNLKSEPEQNSIIYGYQGFLNSLEFPVQIVVRSKKLDIDNYLKQVKELGDKQKNPLLQEQTYEYAEYIKKLVDYADIMDKEFYVVVPYDPATVPGPTTVVQGFFQRLAPKDSFADIKKRLDSFNRLKKTLIQRVSIVKSGLENCGLKVQQLTTPELIELFYNIYNPKTSRSAKLHRLETLAITTDEERAAELGVESSSQNPSVSTPKNA
ncbi:MAG: hypothetical protein PHP74_01225 [Candidatus Gracilibacteria bacterium]|nr:hypothetical protein [Candidatus Gracilibacteria bacterium]